MYHGLQTAQQQWRPNPAEAQNRLQRSGRRLQIPPPARSYKQRPASNHEKRPKNSVNPWPEQSVQVPPPPPPILQNQRSALRRAWRLPRRCQHHSRGQDRNPMSWVVSEANDAAEAGQREVLVGWLSSVKPTTRLDDTVLQTKVNL